MSAFDAVDGAHSDASKCYCGRVETKEFKEVRPGNETTFEVFKELARARRRNADTVVPGIGRTRLGQRTSKCASSIGTRFAQRIRASGHTCRTTGRTRDRTRPMLHQVRKLLPERRPHVTRSVRAHLRGSRAPTYTISSGVVTWMGAVSVSKSANARWLSTATSHGRIGSSDWPS